ncbi:MAG: hypothetical protein ACKO15_00590, partial [Burkholderiales bacterium]
MPKNKTRHSAGYLRQKTLKIPVNQGLLAAGTSIDPASKYGGSPRCGEGGSPISESPVLNK